MNEFDTLPYSSAPEGTPEEFVVHNNPGLIIPCPECGADPNDIHPHELGCTNAEVDTADSTPDSGSTRRVLPAAKKSERFTDDQIKDAVRSQPSTSNGD